MQHPSTPNVPKNHLMPDGGDGDWADYNRLKAQTYDPVHRSIYDSFRYADLSDPNDRLLVEALAQLCDIQLFARCNQQTYRVRSEYRLIDAINLVLSSYDLHMEAPDCLTIPGGDGVVWLWPVYPEAKNKGEEEEDAEDVGEEEDAGVSTETAEPEEWWRPAAASGDRPVRWMVRSWEELETPFPFSRTDANKDNADIWSVPPTPLACYEAKAAANVRLEALYRQKQWEIDNGCHYDSAPLLDDLAKAPEDRLQGDVTYLYPPAGRKALMYCSTTPESHHAHIQSVNAESVQGKFGGTNLGAESLAQIATWQQKKS